MSEKKYQTVGHDPFAQDATSNIPETADDIFNEMAGGADNRRRRRRGVDGEELEKLRSENAELQSQIDQLQNAVDSNIGTDTITRYGNGISLADRFLITPTGLEMPDDLTQDEWINFSDVIDRFETSIQWIIGDWLVYGDGKRYLTWEGLEQHVLGGRYQSETLRKYSRVCSSIDSGRRLPGQSFSLHQVIVESANPNDYDMWLDEINHKKYSVMGLRRAIKPELKTGKTAPAWRKRVDGVTAYFTKRRWTTMSLESKREAYEELQRKIKEMEEWGLD